MNPIIADATRAALTLKTGCRDSCRCARLGPVRKLIRRLQLVVTILAALGLPIGVRGSGTVTNADLGSLNQALAGGGTVVCAFDGTITLTNTLTIAQDTTLDGTGHQVSLDGNNQVRLFLVNTNVTLTLIHLTLTHGLAQGATATKVKTGGPGRGGAVENDAGTVNLRDCVLSLNNAKGGDASQPGGVVPFGTPGPGIGGDVFNAGGVMTASNTTFRYSQASGGWGIGFPYGPAGDAAGGSVYNDGGTLSFTDCTWLRCAVTGGGSLTRVSGISGAGLGGAIFSRAGSVYGTNCMFLQNTNTTPNLAPDYTTNGPVAGGACYFESGNAVFTYSSFISNLVQAGESTQSGDADGGAIYNKGRLELTHCSFFANLATGGTSFRTLDYGTTPNANAGGAVFSIGELTAADSAFLSNSVAGGAAPRYGISSFALMTNGPGNGGAIFTSNSATFLNCSFIANSAIGGAVEYGTAGGMGNGGAIYAIAGTLALTNVSVAGNSAMGGDASQFRRPYYQPAGDGAGGAIYCDGASLTVENSTIANNTAAGGQSGQWPWYPAPAGPAGNAFGGGIYNTNGTVTLQNTIVANNTTNWAPDNAYGAIIDAGNNLSSDASCNFTNATSFNNTDPILGPLDNYGGPTLTMPLLAGSPAIDHGNDAVAPATDQRGHPRPFGAHSDIGAFESSPPYTIRGRAGDFWALTNINVTAGNLTTNTGASGRFAFDGLTSGSYTVSPALTNYLFGPASQTVMVGPDVFGLDFKAYRLNALTPEPLTNVPSHVVFAGPAGTWQIDRSTNLVDWQPISTNTLGAPGLLDISDTNSGPVRLYRAHTR